MRRAASALLVLLTLSCAGISVYEHQEMDTLYFGTQKPDGSAPVTETEWQRFLEDEITTRFPNGLTTWDATGRWRDSRGTVEHERTHVVQIVHRANGEEEGRIVAVMELYKKTFAQEAVFHVRSDVWMPR
jgi:hypothetical protein